MCNPCRPAGWSVTHTRDRVQLHADHAVVDDAGHVIHRLVRLTAEGPPGPVRQRRCRTASGRQTAASASHRTSAQAGNRVRIIADPMLMLTSGTCHVTVRDRRAPSLVASVVWLSLVIMTSFHGCQGDWRFRPVGSDARSARAPRRHCRWVGLVAGINWITTME